MIKVKPGRREGLIKSKGELDVMRKAGRELAAIRDRIAGMVRPGLTTLELDMAARQMIESAGATPAFLNYRGYPKTICASINEEVVHGIPSSKRRLSEGDLISIDIGLVYHGFFSDTAITVPVGKVRPEISRLIEVTRECLDRAIQAAVVGNYLGDISSAVQTLAEGEGFSVVREYSGHGIGRELHEDPQIENYGTPGTGLRLRAGMVFALEPMLNLGVKETRVLGDGWTVVTADGKPSAHFEHTIALTPDGAEILTQTGVAADSPPSAL
jgi:methionyl aminopeptidase